MGALGCWYLTHPHAFTPFTPMPYMHVHRPICKLELIMHRTTGIREMQNVGAHREGCFFSNTHTGLDGEVIFRYQSGWLS